MRVRNDHSVTPQDHGGICKQATLQQYTGSFQLQSPRYRMRIIMDFTMVIFEFIFIIVLLR